MVYEIERDGQSIYCNSAGIVSALLAKGWTLKDSGQRPRLLNEIAAGTSPSTQDPSRGRVPNLTT